MIRISGEVEYEDGRVEAWSAGSAILSRWEIFAHRNGYPMTFEDAPRMLLMQVLAHAAIHPDQELDAWLQTVAEVRFDTDAIAEAVPPTPAALTAAR